MPPAAGLDLLQCSACRFPVNPLPPSGNYLKEPHKRANSSAPLFEMPCRTPLHADDSHAECVLCLGKSHADTALSGTDCSHFSLATLRSRIAFQKVTPPLAPSRPLPPRDLRGRNGRAEDSSGRRRANSCRLSTRVPCRHRRERIRRSSSLNLISVPLRL